MDSVKKVILHENGSKLIGMQLQTKYSTLIQSFGALSALSGKQKVISLEDNEVLVGVKGREEEVKHGGFGLTYSLNNVQFKILSIPKSTI